MDTPVPIDRDRLIMLKVVESIVGLKRKRTYKLIRESDFPAPYKPDGTGSR